MSYDYEDLVLKQQNLIDGLMSGLSKAEAYRQAYPKTKIENCTDQVNKMIGNTNGKFRKFSVVYAKMKDEVLANAKENKNNDIMSETEALERVSEVARGETNDHIAKINKDGELQVFEIPMSQKDRLKALEMILKYYGLLTDKVKVNGELNIKNPFEGLTTEELVKLAGGVD